MTQKWAELEQQCKNCTRCGLAATRQNVVFGVGVTDAEVLFIGEGPGANEDAQGEPFVGRAGKLLDTMLAAVGLSRHHNIYIANMVKCRPPENRDPLPEEQEACIGWLRGQTALLRPKIIVCLGRVAACRLIDPDFKVTRQHGEFFNKNGTLMMGTLHPAALLRNPNNKPAAFADFLALRDKIGVVCEHTTLWYPAE
ncbi:MAG: uracil-DNA glycosylase [Clostridia bacterium]|nr:uracil-DNA glycosylase [Clostridia bacterium]